MNMLRIFTDTDCDITPEIAKKYGFELISMPYSVDGKEVKPYVDFEKFEPKPFYDMLRSGVLPKTSAVNVETYKQYFEPFFKQGDEILYLHFSESMSGTFKNMRAAVEELRATYPDLKFNEVNTAGMTILAYTLICLAGDMYKEGKSSAEIIEMIENEKQHYAIYLFADDLKFFKHSGRVSGLAATMGTVLGVRPIIHINSDGQLVSIGKERGRINALERLVSYVEELGDDVKSYRFIVGHSDAEEVADQLIEMLKEKLGDDLVAEKVVVNPTIGSHCGPNAVGVCFHSIHR